MHDHRGEGNQHVRQDIGRDNIIFLIAGLVLNSLVVDDIADHHVKRLIRDLIGFFIFFHSGNRAGIQIGSRHMSSSQLQGHDPQDPASGSHVKDLVPFFYVFLQLADHQLGRLVHAGSERGSRIDVKDHLVLIFRLHFLPGGDDQNIVHIKLMEIFLPVIDPVFIFRTGFLNASLSDIHKGTQFFQSVPYIFQDFLFIRVLFQIET